MDQKRLIAAISISIAILLIFQFLVQPHLPQPPAPPPPPAHVAATQPKPAPAGPGAPATAAPATAHAAVPANVPRVKISTPRLTGSVSLLGARIDDLILNDFRETLAPDSPNVRLLRPLSTEQPYYVQYGWATAPGETLKVPDNNTLWTASADTVSADHPVTLTWDNGQGLTFQLLVSVDDQYMFTVTQSVKNASANPVQLYPWARIMRGYTPVAEGFNSLYGGINQGLFGVVNGSLHSMTYDTVKSRGKKNNGIAFSATGQGGWAGITDKYWLTALIPDRTVPVKVAYQFIDEGNGAYQVSYLAQNATTVLPGATGDKQWRTFAGAKLVNLLNRYAAEYHIPYFNKAVDFGWLFLVARPIFYCLDWLNSLLGNFGLAILAFTTGVKILFFPLANYSYRSMSKMKLLGPKMTALRERLKDDPQKMQQEMMAMYRAEGVNPASGCLPMVVQIPVFAALYVVIYTTIEMRHAPFFGWIRDLSQPDPTNFFNLFGVLPFDPTIIPAFGYYLHIGLWPLIMGGTMWLQQKLNPPPPDPVQARLFQFMPVLFTFMLARFPAGLVIYWTWNNLLSVGQQWLIMRRTRLARPGLART
jgi:YidC/Oxa1 family membrane protein insertase